MANEILSPIYQAFYIAIPTMSIIGNFFMIYVTIRSRVPDHLIRQDVCTYLQLFPLCGFLASLVLLLNLAIDRLLSLQKFYLSLSRQYKVAYTSVQVSSVLLYTLFFGIWIFISRSTEEKVFCVLTAPLKDNLYAVLTRTLMIINILIVLCYVVFMCLLKTVQISYDVMKNVYRSLIAISLTVVFGSFSTIFISFFAQTLELNINRADVNLVSGLFVNSSCSINFFVFYAFSTDYRQVFQEYLPCFGSKVSRVSTITANVIPFSSAAHSRRPSRIV
ncbi:hypothetical protein V3C99_006924 [Haemonchus contortus]